MILIEAPSNLGLIEPRPGEEPGVRFFPQTMEKEGFARKAGIHEKITVRAPSYSMFIDGESKVRNAPKIVDYSKRLADVLDEHIKKRNVPVIIGGDCSILIGAALSLKRNGDYGLLFLDGHTDYVLPEQSGTAGAAGMDLAIVTGNGHNKLTDIEHRKPYIREQNVFCLGNRELSADWYVNAIAESNIHYYDLYALRSTGFLPVTQLFLDLVASKNLDGFWIHLDVDVLNNEIMPCVDSPQEDGLSYEELAEILDILTRSVYFVGIDITIFDSTLDAGGLHGKMLAEQLANIFKNISAGR